MSGGERRGISPGNSQSAGFSLLETLTALTILAIALVSLFQIQGTGLRVAGVADHYGQARILAHSLLAGTLGGAGIVPRSGAGREGPFIWSVVVSRAGQPCAETRSAKNWCLHHIRVTVAWDKDRQVELQTLKLAHTAREN